MRGLSHAIRTNNLDRKAGADAIRIVRVVVVGARTSVRVNIAEVRRGPKARRSFPPVVCSYPIAISKIVVSSYRWSNPIFTDNLAWHKDISVITVLPNVVWLHSIADIC